jgi:hypothetical protein
MHINCLSSDVTLSSQNPRDAVWSEEERGFFNMDAASTAHTNLTIGCTAWNPLDSGRQRSFHNTVNTDIVIIVPPKKETTLRVSKA